MLIALFLMLAILTATNNPSLAAPSFPIVARIGILAYAMDDEERNAWKGRY
jgi:hypothetical protein